VNAGAEQFYRQHQNFVWRNARRLGCADDWVDDAVQEVFLVAVRRMSELDAESNVRGWLFAILVRVVQRLLRDRGRYRARLRRYSATSPTDRVDSPEGQSHAARMLRDLVARLDETKRVIVILIELEGMTSAEASRVLGIPQGTVDSRLRAARRQLARWIDQQSSDETQEAP
jgi:RNA polymerase sigma-70 factor (ECF subfamily)